jgi:hypothetical protein
MSTPEGKYQIWGFVANANFDDANRDVNSQNQTGEPTEVCVYATDDKDEARTIMRNGGFFREDGKTWVVARRGVTVDA